MSRFRFPLQRLLQLRSEVERDRARALGHAVRAAQEREAAVSRAHESLGRAGEQLRSGTGAPRRAGTLRNLGLTLQSALLALQAAATSHRHATEAVDRESARLGEARRERRVLEKLRERRHSDWREESARLEQRDADDLHESRRRHREDQR